MIDIQKCIQRQKDIDAHPKFWEKPEEEIQELLSKALERAYKNVVEYESKPNLTRLEYSILDSARQLIRLVEE